MNRISIILIVPFIFLLACAKKEAGDRINDSIKKIENGLLPGILIDGAEPEVYNIYDRMGHYKVSGVSIAFLDNGKIAWAKGYGFTGYDSLSPVNENTLFQAASISKPVAALAALTLVEEGEIDLDENVNKYLKGWQVEENEFTKQEKVTLRRLLSHSAGLTVHGFGGYAYHDTIPTTIQVLNGEPPANSGRIYPYEIPGKMYSYSGGGYTVMQKMLVDVASKSFPEIIAERVLEKAGMSNSSYIQPLPEKRHINAAKGHRADGSLVEGNWHIYPEMAAAGLWTTPSDLLKYAIEVQKSYAGKTNTIISEKTAKEMLTAQKDSHGLGPAVGGNGKMLRFSHGGANEGYRCQLFAFAENGQGVAVMTNGDNGSDLCSEIMRSFSACYNWPVYKPEKKKLFDMNQKQLSEFAGKYKYTEDSIIIELVVKEDHLEGKQHWDNLTFSVYPESELEFFGREDGASFSFKRGESGSITEVVIHEQYKFIREN